MYSDLWNLGADFLFLCLYPGQYIPGKEVRLWISASSGVLEINTHVKIVHLYAETLFLT